LEPPKKKREILKKMTFLCFREHKNMGVRNEKGMKKPPMHLAPGAQEFI
jgi:hypothetical protein